MTREQRERALLVMENPDMFTEGANLDTREIFKDMKFELVALRKKTKQAMRTRDYDTAMKCAERESQLLDETYQKVLNVGSSVGSVILGLFFRNIPFFFQDLILAATVAIGGTYAEEKTGKNFNNATKNIGRVNEFRKFIERLQVIVQDIKEQGSHPLEDFNFYKNAIKVRINEYKHMNKTLIGKIKYKQSQERKRLSQIQKNVTSI